MYYLLRIFILLTSLTSIAKAQSCPANEKYVDCSAPMCQNTCAEPNKNVYCNPGIVCEAGCVCTNNNYLRKYSQGPCILRNTCPKCGPNEHYACGSPCDTECAFLNQPCPIELSFCVERCYCNDGFARNNKGICVPLNKCTPLTCPVNQEIEWCPVPRECEVDCNNKGVFDDKPYCYDQPTVCYPRCVCKEGFIKNKNTGNCIKPSSCKCNDPNAVMVAWPNPCLGGTCKQPWFSDCNIAPNPYGCQCRSGFAKNSKGKCMKLPCVF